MIVDQIVTEMSLVPHELHIRERLYFQKEQILRTVSYRLKSLSKNTRSGNRCRLVQVGTKDVSSFRADDDFTVTVRRHDHRKT